MGSVIFEWGAEGSLILLQYRDDVKSRVIVRAEWDQEKRILGGRLDEKEGGMWCGVSGGGRVACLLEGIIPGRVTGFDQFPVDFLKSNTSPDEFAKELMGRKDLIKQEFHLVVGDMVSKSMVYVGTCIPYPPQLTKRKLGFGIHILSLIGLGVVDQTSKREKLKGAFTEMLIHHKVRGLPELDAIVSHVRAMTNDCSDDIRTSTALEVKPDGEVVFHERSFENGKSEERGFDFIIHPH